MSLERKSSALELDFWFSEFDIELVLGLSVR